MSPNTVTVDIKYDDSKTKYKYLVEVTGLGYNSIFTTTKVNFTAPWNRAYRDLTRCLKTIGVDKETSLQTLTRFQNEIDNSDLSTRKHLTLTYMHQKNVIVAA